MPARRRSIFFLLAWLGGCDPIATPEARTALTACFDTCKDHALSATDQATCRLNCAEAAKSPPFPTKPPPLAATANCIAACDPGGDSPAPPACVAACRPPEIAPAVLDRLTTCVEDCQSDVKSRDDDRATCRLLCAQDVPPAS